MGDDTMITVRKASLEDREDFRNLLLISAPYFPQLFGKSISKVLEDMFHRPSNLFSWHHVWFVEVEGKKAGMLLGYDWKIKERENIRTGLLLIKNLKWNFVKKLPVLMRFNVSVGTFGRGEYYISNIAIYPEYRGMGIGKRLMAFAHREAEGSGAERVVLDVERDNEGAITFYRKIGYEITGEFSIPLQKGKTLHFYRMRRKIRL